MDQKDYTAIILLNNTLTIVQYYAKKFQNSQKLHMKYINIVIKKQIALKFQIIDAKKKNQLLITFN